MNIMKEFKLTRNRKFLLAIWVIIMIFPSIFMVGKVVEGHTLIEQGINEHGKKYDKEPRVWTWNDLIPYFVILFFSTIVFYWMAGVEETKGEKR